MKIKLIATWIVITLVGLGCSQGKTEEYLRALKSANITARYEAVSSLVQAADEVDAVVVLALIKLLGDESRRVRLKAIEALGAIGEKTAVPALIKILADPDTAFQEQAIVALGNIRDLRAVTPLIKLLNGADKEPLKLAAIWSLGNIGDKRAAPALMVLLDSQDKYVRYNANRALKKID